MSRVRHLRRGDPGWPAGLDDLDLPPSALWLLGPYTPALPAVAVVGARDATAGGLEVARRLGADLAGAGIPVVSGMALGIDAAAHRGALDARGHTVAVLGCGIDICYPPRHRELRERIAQSGSVLTEEPPGTPPTGWRFPRRNRIIAALATVVVVVEASRRSGALSTARYAADLGRDVFAVPGSVLSERSGGANDLIRDGATPLLETADLAAARLLAPALEAARGAFRLSTVTTRSGAPGGGRLAHLGLAPELAAVLRLVGPDPVHPDRLAAELCLTPASLSARLAALELRGLLRSADGGLVSRELGEAGIDSPPKLGTTLPVPSGTFPEPLL